MFQNIKEGINEMVDKLKGHHHPTTAKEQLKDLQQQAENVDPLLMPMFNDLKEMSEKLHALGQQEVVTPHDLLPLREKLADMDSVYHEGRFDIEGIDKIPSGQAAVADMLSECHEKLRAILERTDYYKVSDELRPYHDKLTNILMALKKVEKKDNPMPKDVRNLRKKLTEIDAHYQMGAIRVGGTVPEGQAVIAELLEDAHATVNRILMKSDYYSVGPELMSVHDRLENIIMGLEGLMAKHEVSEADVAKYTHQLGKVDELYQEGRFVINGEFDFEGQAHCSDLLRKAHDLVQSVQDRIVTVSQE